LVLQSRWKFAAAVSIGVLVGVGLVTFDYAEGTSYFSTDPRACANCHIMQSQYDSWQKASHHTVAACVDCHLPHALLPKYLAKARNGWNHSKGFTLQDFPEPILITPPNAAILHENCLACHGDFVHAQTGGSDAPSAAPRCVTCHSAVGHGPRAGLGGPLRDDELPSATERRSE
jgi:cytochrome c nitrite reductase small subunit